MNRVCLDTSAYSNFMRGDPAAVEALRTARSVLVPVIVLGELRAGFRAGSRAAMNEQELKKLLARPVASVMDVDEEVSEIYAQLFSDLRRAGTPLPTNDVWIAAIAVREGATVLTYDAHFEKIARVGVQVLA